MDKDKYIYTKSIKAAAYIIYCTKTRVDVVENEIGENTFRFTKTDYIKYCYDYYKEKARNHKGLIVDSFAYEGICKMLKRKTKDWRRNRKTEKEIMESNMLNKCIEEIEGYSDMM